MKGITRTELVWVDKYDDEGNLRPVEHTILPFQVLETNNESKADREKTRRPVHHHAARRYLAQHAHLGGQQGGHVLAPAALCPQDQPHLH
jgi:hypothetical protein